MQPLPSSGQKKPRSQRGGSSSIGWKPYWNSSLRQSLFMHVPSTGVVKFPSLLNKLGEEEFDEEGAQNVRSSQSERNLWVVASILLFETVQFPPSATDPQRPYAILKENSSSSRARMCRIEVQRLLVERHAIRSVVSAHRRGGDQDQADFRLVSKRPTGRRLQQEGYRRSEVQRGGLHATCVASVAPTRACRNVVLNLPCRSLHPSRCFIARVASRCVEQIETHR